ERATSAWRDLLLPPGTARRGPRRKRRERRRRGTPAAWKTEAALGKAPSAELELDPLARGEDLELWGAEGGPLAAGGDLLLHVRVGLHRIVVGDGELLHPGGDGQVDHGGGARMAPADLRAVLLVGVLAVGDEEVGAGAEVHQRPGHLAHRHRIPHRSLAI